MKQVQSQIDFPALERELLEYWYNEGIVQKYLHRNDESDKKFSFLDGPITANNPMGVHHAWGRSYKDLWQRWYNMRGYKQRFQNGFDEQGLWVEVEVEKELGLKNKKDIENLVPGDTYASLEKFVNLCKDRVKKYSGIQTEQSKRLGYFMDWDNSYHTSSETNNYCIWNFLKVVHDKGWLYKGIDSVPWCPRCGTAISQHEILTEEYKELTHTSIYFKLPIIGRDHEFLLVWTTTPWTIPANVAVAVDPEKKYLAVRIKNIELNIEEIIWVLEDAVNRLQEKQILPADAATVTTCLGRDLVGLEYKAAFDELPAVKQAFGDYKHRVVASDPLLLPISGEDGTGMVHIAPGAGAEDFALGKKEKLPVVGPIDDAANYYEGYGDLTGQNVNDVIGIVITSLQNGNFLFTKEKYTHRYPTCWRCKSELVWRVVDEWYIAMDRADESGKTYREQMMEVAREINWIPRWGLDRELDWLKNMHDWLISKKRYWGLALPIYECEACGTFEVIGSQEDLKSKAVEGWDKFDGHTPHKPWIDAVKIKCSNCGQTISRIADVGNPWLDAGIVPFSTLPEDFFPADFVTEAFPGQFKNWFYSMIAMSTALKSTNPFRNLLGHAMVRDEHGEEMHKSKGNSIEFNEAADKMGVDIARWIYVTQNPENNVNFGFGVADEIRRRFYLILWNSYKFFVEYALLSGWTCEATPGDIREKLTVLDRWILSRLTELVLLVNKSLGEFDAATASQAIERFVIDDLSTWYIRRSRDRVGPGADKSDETVFLSTTYGILITLTKLMAPFMPFISEEIFRNLTGEESVHLQNFPQGDESLLNTELNADMVLVRKLVEQGHSLRKEAAIKLRQPLASFTYTYTKRFDADLEQVMADELNVKSIQYTEGKVVEPQGQMDLEITPELEEEGKVRELSRQVQILRKEAGLTLMDKIKIIAPEIPARDDLKTQLMNQTSAVEMIQGESLAIQKV
jgi:isoleucyl-tRNA synthetase